MSTRARNAPTIAAAPRWWGGDPGARGSRDPGPAVSCAWRTLNGLDELMAWTIGAEVIVRTFGNRRGVVIAVAGDGRHRVRINGVLMWVREQDLATPDATRKKRPRPAPVPDLSTPPPPGPGERLDLHGLRVEEALARVMEAIDRALLRGADRLEIVHGKGAGRLRAALHRQLAALPVVPAYRLDPGNPGVTWVYF